MTESDTAPIADTATEIAPIAAVPDTQVVLAPLPEAVVIDRPRRRARRVAAFGVAFVVGLVAVVGIAGGALAAWDSRYQERVLPGVHVAGIDVSGMDRTQATQAVAAALPYDQGRIVLRGPSGDITIPYSAFGRTAGVDSLVDAALRAGRDGDTLVRAVAEIGQALHGITIDPVVRLDERALAFAITGALAPLGSTAVSASVAMTQSGPITTPGHAGLRVDPAPAIAAALDALRSTGAPAELIVPVSSVSVPPAVSDDTASAVVASSKRLVSTVVVKLGTQKWQLSAASVRSWIGFVSGAGSVRLVLDPKVVAKSLSKVAKGVARKPVSAIYLRSRAGKIVGVAASGNGRSLDTDETVNRILAELGSRLTGGKPSPVKVATRPVAPEFTTAQAQKKAPLMSILGTWTTWFPIGDHNFWGANIWIPASLIDGTVLQPGQTFDWWATVGQVSPARGYGPGGFIKGNHTEPTGALGGGMCSSSTTLFNAALRAGLQMGARGNHTYYINRYPLGLDATVWKAGSATQDMSFTNDTRGPLFIRGIRTHSGLTGYVTYQIWGVPDGRTVALSSPSVTNVVKATTNTVKVSTLPHGVVKQTEWPSNQMDTAVTRVVRNAAGAIIHVETFRSHYVLWNGLIQVGR